MKKIYLLAVISCLSLFGYSQVFTNKKDAFTGKDIKSAIVPMGKTIAPTGMMVGFGIADQKTIIFFMWPANAGIFGAFNSTKINEASLLFKLDDDSIMKFKADTNMSKILNNVNTSSLVIGSEISQADLKTLRDHLIAVFRVGGKDDVGVDLDNKYLFTDKNKQQLQKAAAYMIE